MNNTSFTSEKEGKYTENVNLLENNNNKTPSIEIEHVREVYNFIAKQWHSTRYKAWPIVGEFCKTQHFSTFLSNLLRPRGQCAK